MVIIVEVYKFLVKYDLVDKLEVLNASFLFVNSTEYSFSKNDWIEAVKLHVQEAQEIASVLFSILRSNSLIEQVSENVYTISDMDHFYKKFNEMIFYRNFTKEIKIKPPSRLLWNMQYSVKQQLPQNVRIEFEELTSYLKDILSVAENKIIFCAPYFSISGIKILNNSIQSALEVHPDLKIWFIIDALELEYTQTFIREINNLLPKRNFIIFVPSENLNNSLLFHSKFLIVDNKYGYLGSANFSERALSQQFEIGIKLFEEDCSKLSLLVESWTALKYFKEFN